MISIPIQQLLIFKKYRVREIITSIWIEYDKIDTLDIIKWPILFWQLESEILFWSYDNTTCKGIT